MIARGEARSSGDVFHSARHHAFAAIIPLPEVVPFSSRQSKGKFFAVSDSVAALRMAAVQNGRQPGGGVRLESSVDSQELRCDAHHFGYMFVVS